ncbi:hypothetical protein [Actinoplanes aureus]|uniref:Uncharacterized protein n=1 Tax=Actinoplanes aureus TaxID=2792083 RepID=A0A931CFH0_9ACTN|nr:hypothetical protein [Actinoplanes aureus]MBG0569169.1 hypothetical protein [Actinoplanes aureus]
MLTTALHLLDTRNTHAARDVLSRHLDTVDLTAYTDDPVLIDLVLLYASLTDGPRQLTAAEFAYATTRLPGWDQPRRDQAAWLLGTAAHHQHDYPRASAIRTALLSNLHSTDPSEALRVRTELADSLHHSGRCGEAVRHAEQAWRGWQHSTEPSPYLGARIAISYARKLAACQRHTDLHALIAQARDADSSFETPLHPLTPGSPTADALAAQHHPICAGRLCTDGVLDVDALTADHPHPGQQ